MKGKRGVIPDAATVLDCLGYCDSMPRAGAEITPMNISLSKD